MSIDYSTYLDDEVLAFLQKTESHYPPNAVELSIAQQRAVYDQMCQAFDQGRPESVVSQDMPMAGVPCRVYESKELPKGTIVFCHGGGFVVGGLNSHDSICAEFCASTHMRVVSIDYRLSPEHPYPDDFNDAWAAFVEVCQSYEGPVILCGDSAGGNLVAAIAHYARRFEGGRYRARITGQLLIYPGLGGDQTKGSYLTHSDAPGLSTKEMEFYMHLRSSGKDLGADPCFAPLQDTDFSNLPNTVIITAECDPLEADGESYRDAILAAGGQAEWINERGLVHGYLRARSMSQKARASFDRMLDALNTLSIF